jgi:hypothetical protein
MKQALKMKDVTGAKASDVADGHKLAIEVYGPLGLTDDDSRNNSGLTAFAYLWRRFGPPIYGSDSHKELCCYYLTTEDPQVFLFVSPSGSGLAYAFGYMVKKSLERKHFKETCGPLLAWNKKFETWWIKRNKETFPILRSNKAYKDASESDKQLVAEAFSDVRWGQNAQTDLAEKDIGKYPGRTEHSKASRHIQDTLKKAMRELLRPVYVRDAAINILGRCDDTDDSVESSEFAGIGIPQAPLRKLMRT